MAINKIGKKRVFSGIQPSGDLHIGNYFGAIKNWVEMQDKYEAIFCIVDLHAITVPQNPDELKRRTLEIAKIYFASGIDPKKSSVFIQSQIKEHLELYWILNTITKVSELLLMTQYKDKSQSQEKNGIFAGLLNYPVLMASDILLYDTEIVPVGEDQRQHVELSRELARRFNEKFGETFNIPKSLIEKSGGKIMGLDNPTKKMSKSAESENNYILLKDSPEVALKKIKKAVTDSDKEIKFNEKEKPGISNLLTINSLLSQKTIKELEKDYINKSYSDFKNETGEIVAEFLKNFQYKYNNLKDEEVLNYLKEGKEKVSQIASKKIEDVYKKVGLL